MTKLSVRSFVCLAVAIAATTAVHAQLARKPSMYEAEKPLAPANNQVQSLMARPDGSKSPSQSMGDRSSQPFLPALRSQADFDQLARVYDAGTPLAQPHVIFVLDRRTKPGQTRLYFINTPRFQLHDRFLRDHGLLSGDKEALLRNYRAPDRRFVLGTISWQPQIKAFVYEFWEGDQLTSELLHNTAAALSLDFFAPLQFKANASAHEQVAASAGITAITQAALIGQQDFLPLNTGVAVGRLRLVDDVNTVRDLQPSDIVGCAKCPSPCRQWRVW